MIIIAHNDQDETYEFYKFHKKIEHVIKLGGTQCNTYGGIRICVLGTG